MSASPIFAALAARDPESLIFHGSRSSWCARDVLDAVSRSAARLEGTRVLAILADNSPDWVLADLAALKARTPVLPLPLFFSPAQLTHALEQTGADLVVTDQPERILSLEIGFSIAEQHLNLAWLRRQVAPVQLPEGTAKISYTSGSTGAPKGVCLSAEGLIDTAMALKSGLSDLRIERHLAVLPLALLLENSAGVYAPLLRGAEIHLTDLASLGWQGMAGFDPRLLQHKVDELRPNSLILVPELLKAWTMLLAHSGQRAAGELAYVAVGGSRVEPGLLAQARQLGVPAYQGYGLTECGSVVSLNRPGDDGDGVGRPLPHVRVVIRDDEIHIASRAFCGYLGDAPARPGADYATGDLGHFDDEGMLHLSGRRKNLLITSFGRNISPEWVEASLLAQPQIAQAVVAGDNRPALAAIVVPSSGVSRSDVAAAIARTNASLPDYARLAGWVDAAPFTLQNGMLTGNGRPVRSAILDHYAAALAALYNEQSDEESDEQSIKETTHAFL